MSETAEPEQAPKLPEVDSPPPEDVLDGVPSKDAIVGDARPRQEVVEEQPDVDEILGRQPPSSPGGPRTV